MVISASSFALAGTFVAHVAPPAGRVASARLCLTTGEIKEIAFACATSLTLAH